MSKNNTIPVETFPPGEFIKDELAARGWEQRDLAEIMGRPERLVSELIAGKRALTPETAQQLGQAFGTGAQLWLNLESAYRLHQLGEPDETVARRSRLYSAAPIKEMLQRGWIVESENVTVMEQQVMQFFETNSLDAPPSFFAAAARKSTSYNHFSPAQTAWLFRAKQLAANLKVGKFEGHAFKTKLPELRGLLMNPEDVRQVPKVLSSLGVRCVVVEHLPETKIDGACFWLDKQSPVVALSVRFDRIDCFWFTLMHELGHVVAGDGLNEPLAPDIDLVGGQGESVRTKPKVEAAADAFASSFIIPAPALTDFVRRVKPFFSKQKVEEFAATQRVHPGLVVGQLQHRKLIPYANLRASLVKVRSGFLETVMSDGWGMTP
jgi:HTH-type transcriptional regulator/antitoxin HigA